MFCGGAISCVSKLQRVVALCATETEYIVLSAVAQEVLFLRNVFNLLNQITHGSVLSSSRTTTAVLAVMQSNKPGRNRHIDPRHNFLRGLVKKGEVNARQVGTAYQHADVLTKS
ncbi:unnamed protein product, partial [Discosporangium mesarthrocarpum]